MIEVHDVSYRYSGAERSAVRNLNFHIASGEIFGLLGPNGAGKSTTQKILIRLLRDYTGSISALGRDLGSWNADYYERVGVSFELPNHYLKLSGLENLNSFRALYRDHTESPQTLLDLVDLSDDGGMLVSQYSKGMKNRLSVARALLNNPELIFMDEPTAGLDPVSARRIKQLIRSQKDKGRTVFLTTHDMTVADELCDRVAFLVDGEIKLIEAPRELKLRHGKHRLRVEYRANGHLEQKEFALEGLADNTEFLALLRNQEVETLHTLEASLEQVFIEVTGRGLA